MREFAREEERVVTRIVRDGAPHALACREWSEALWGLDREGQGSLVDFPAAIPSRLNRDVDLILQANQLFEAAIVIWREESVRRRALQRGGIVSHDLPVSARAVVVANGVTAGQRDE